MNNLSRLMFLLGSWATALPARQRKYVYDGVKVLSGLATVALLVLPELPAVGLTWTGSQVAMTALTAALSLLGQLASRNVDTPVQVDMAPAPEPTATVTDPAAPAPAPAPAPNPSM